MYQPDMDGGYMLLLWGLCHNVEDGFFEPVAYQGIKPDVTLL